MKKIEFHVHTIASKDSFQTKFLMVLMCKLKKINCLVITDHNEIWYAKKYKDYFKKYNVDIIIGEEILTTDGEVIGLFLNEKIEPNLSFEKTVELIKQQDGLVYVPHPFEPKRNKTVLNETVLKKYKDNVDFIEVHNGRNFCEEVSKKQFEIADCYSLRKIIGSDSHTFYELGRNYCLVESYEKDKLISNMENAVFCKKKCIKFAHLNTKFVKVIKMFIKGDFDGIIRIINRKIKKRK